MPRSDWERQADFMRAHGATEATWQMNLDGDVVLTSLKLAPTAPRPAQPAAPAGPAAKLADAFANKLKRDNEIRFAASHFRPRVETPDVKDDVPRAVRAREAAGGASSNKRRR